MKKSIYSILLTVGVTILIGCSGGNNQNQEPMNITFDNSIMLPDYGGKPNPGVAGAFGGFLPDGRLAIAGGANFPEGYPWTGAKKVWYRTLYLLDTLTNQWEIVEDFLDRPLGYGFSIQTESGVMAIGGSNADGASADVVLMTIREGKPAVDSTAYPSLPYQLSNMAGARVGNRVYLAGGVIGSEVDEASSSFLMLDLDDLAAGWQKLEPWPGPRLGFSVAAALDGRFYLFSGRDFGPDRELEMKDRGYCYDPATGKWSEIDNQFPYMAGTAVSVADRVLFIGGVEELIPGSLDHPGFSRKVRAYDPKTNRVDSVATSPYPIAVTTTAAINADSSAVFLCSGEVSPGIRTPHILRLSLR